MSSWAKVKHHTISDDSVELIFVYFWQNSTNVTMVITVAAPIILNGFANCYALPTRSQERGDSADLRLSVELEAFDWPANIQDAGVSSGAWQVADLWAHGSRYDGDPESEGLGEGDSVSQSVFGNFNLRIEDLVVHPGKAKAFVLFLKIVTWAVWYGGTDVDFSSNYFQVTSPYAVIDRGAGIVGNVIT